MKELDNGGSGFEEKMLAFLRIKISLLFKPDVNQDPVVVDKADGPFSQPEKADQDFFLDLLAAPEKENIFKIGEIDCQPDLKERFHRHRLFQTLFRNLLEIGCIEKSRHLANQLFPSGAHGLNPVE